MLESNIQSKAESLHRRIVISIPCVRHIRISAIDVSYVYISRPPVQRRPAPKILAREVNASPLHFHIVQPFLRDIVTYLDILQADVCYILNITCVGIMMAAVERGIDRKSVV